MKLLQNMCLRAGQSYKGIRPRPLDAGDDKKTAIIVGDNQKFDRYTNHAWMYWDLLLHRTNLIYMYVVSEDS